MPMVSFFAVSSAALVVDVSAAVAIAAKATVGKEPAWPGANLAVDVSVFTASEVSARRRKTLQIRALDSPADFKQRLENENEQNEVEIQK